MEEINQAKLNGWRRLVQSGRVELVNVPEPYKTILEQE